MTWVMKAARRKLNMAPEASLLQDGAKSEPKGAGRLPCPQTRALGTSGVPWDQLSEQKWELIYFPGELTTVYVVALCPLVRVPLSTTGPHHQHRGPKFR